MKNAFTVTTKEHPIEIYLKRRVFDTLCFRAIGRKATYDEVWWLLKELQHRVPKLIEALLRERVQKETAHRDLLGNTIQF